MNKLEDEVRSALGSAAATRTVDVDALWRATSLRLRRSSVARAFLGVTAVVAAGGVAAAFGIAALTPEPVTTQPFAPAVVPTATSLPSPSPAIDHREAEQVLKAAQLTADDRGGAPLYPVEVVIGADKSTWALGAYRQPADAPRNVSGEPMMCAVTLQLSPSRRGGGAGCTGPVLPQPEDPGNAVLSSTHSLNLPIDGDGQHVETGREFHAGLASRAVTRVVGVDAAGVSYDAVLVGQDLPHWEVLQYFVVTKTSVTLTKVLAYDAAGKLLTTVPVVG